VCNPEHHAARRASLVNEGVVDLLPVDLERRAELAHLHRPAGQRCRQAGNGAVEHHLAGALQALYARQVPGASPGEREQAVDQLLAWYLHQTDAANEHLRALAGSPVPAEFSGRDDALAWLDAERPSLVAAVTMAAATGRNMEAMFLPLNLSEYLHWRRRFDDLLTVLAISRDSARQLNDKDREAGALGNLGNALVEVRRSEEAVSACQGAAAVFREIGDRHREGTALANLGIAYEELANPVNPRQQS
jgi:hypothetical protein